MMRISTIIDGINIRLFATLFFYFFTLNQSASAQINGDTTLPTNSRVTVENSTFNIEDGTRAGDNLFHSFRDFSLPTGQEAFFNNQLDIQNIIGRVTGGSVSNIDGLIRANGRANLFLINPNGINFGENASLNIGGSFVGSTANAIQFGENGFFRATNPEQSTPLLTINPSALFFNQQTNAPIQNNSRVDLEVSRSREGDFNLERIGIRVPDGNSLLLVGGDINLDGAGLNAYGGRVELGAIASPGSIGLNINNQDISLNFPQNVTGGKISLTNVSSIDVLGTDGGNIALHGRELNVADQTRILIGIAPNSGQKVSQTGNVDLNVTESIKLERLGRIENSTGRGSIGNAGSVNVNTNLLELVTGGQIQADNNGLGRGGSININAGDIVVDGSFTRVSSGLFTRILSEGTGDAGDININANSMTVSNGGVLLTQTGGRGNAGDVIINVPEGIVKFSGGANPQTENGFDVASNIASSVLPGARGNGGNIDIRAREFLLLGDELKRDNIKSAALFASTGNPGLGNGGNVTITASDRIIIDGVAEEGKRAGIFSTINRQGKGDGGTINLITKPDGIISLDNGSLLINNSFGEGTAGDINISTGKFLLQNNSLLLSQTNGKGDTGQININAKDRVIFDNESFAFNGVLGNGIGDAKDVRINTGEFIINNQSGISASTSGQGNAGSVIVNARNSAKFLNGGNISARVNNSGQGDAGNIFITTGENGNGGFVTFDRKAALTVQTAGVGNSGSINIATDIFSLLNNSILIAGTRGKGNAGQININAQRRVEFAGESLILNNVEKQAVGNGGGVNINTSELLLHDQGKIIVSTNGEGDAGSINLNASKDIVFDGEDVGIFSSVDEEKFKPDGSLRQGGSVILTSPNVFIGNGALMVVSNNAIGNGGNVFIDANKFTLRGDSVINVSSKQTGGAGNIQIDASSILLDDKAVLNASRRGLNPQPNPQEATINLNAEAIILRRQSVIATNAQGENVIGGNININTGVLAGLENSDITANSSDSRGGNISINAEGIFGIEPRNQITSQSDITATGATQELSGNIEISNTLDPSRGLIELPVNFGNASDQIASACKPGSPQQQNSFTVTGRGSLPPHPFESLSGNLNQTPLAKLSNDSQTSNSASVPSTATPPTIVEAQAWIVNEEGKIQLIAEKPQAKTFRYIQEC